MRANSVLTVLCAVLVLAACSSSGEIAGAVDQAAGPSTNNPTEPPGGNGAWTAPLQLSANYGIVEQNGRRVLRTSLVALNTGTTEVGGLSGAYPWRLSVYADSARTDLVWRVDSYLTRVPDLGRQFAIPGGASRSFDAGWFPSVPVATILGSRQPGRYFASMELLLEQPSLRSAPMAAGEIDLQL